MTETGYRRAILGVALASALLCLPFLGSFPLFDPDEGYYPAAAAESLREGHPLDLTLNGEPRWNKPPLSYALMQVSMSVLGVKEFAVRLPSVLEGAALVAILGLLTARVAGGRAGLLSSVVLASCIGHQVMSRAAHPEMGLVLGTATAQLVFAIWFVAPPGGRPRWAWFDAGLAMAFGFLAKGPAALAMPALMLVAGMLVFPRENRPTWREVGRVFGLACYLCVALGAPWFLWMASRHPDFMDVALGQLKNYTEESRSGFRASPFFFVPVLVGAFLPWIVLLPGALRGLRRTDPSPVDRLRLLMALAAGTSFLFWSLSSAKNPHYALVFLPPLAALVGQRLAAFPLRRTTLLSAASALAVVGMLALCRHGYLVAKFHPGFAVREMGREMGEVIRKSEAESYYLRVGVYRRRLPSLSFYSGRHIGVIAGKWDLFNSWLHYKHDQWMVIHRSDLGDLPKVDPVRRVLLEDEQSELMLIEPGRP